MLLVLTASAAAQDISPQPATPDDEIRLHFVLPVPGCFNEITDVAVSVDGTAVSVGVVVDEVEAPVCPTSPPLVLDVALGSFAPGSYEMILGGLILEQAFGPISADFEVLLGNSATAVPTLSPTGLALLLVLLSVTGMLFLSAKR